MTSLRMEDWAIMKGLFRLRFGTYILIAMLFASMTLVACAAGADGANGANGAPGKDGAAGRAGPAGADGADGENGKDGAATLSFITARAILNFAKNLDLKKIIICGGG